MTSLSERMLLALLKASLHEEMPENNCFEQASPQDWLACSQLATRQGVVILAWDGIALLPSHLQPSPELKIAWALAVKKYENKYKYYCDTVHELSAFYEKQHIQMVQLKGVGLSTYYPIPSHREGGDIDIYTLSADPNLYTDSEANLLANTLMEEQGIRVSYGHPKHTNFTYKGLMIENHKTFLDVDRCPLAVQVEKILKDCLQPEHVELLEGKRILIPSASFNTLFVAFHAAQHYGSGLALHHLYDWGCIIKKYGLNIPQEITDRHFLNGVYAMTHLCNLYLGTSVPVKGGEKLAQEMLKEILHPFEAILPPSGAWNYLKYKIKRIWNVCYTTNRILYIPWWKNAALWKKVRESLLWHLASPKRFLYGPENY